jgi:hypothetical protein
MTVDNIQFTTKYGVVLVRSDINVHGIIVEHCTGTRYNRRLDGWKFISTDGQTTMSDTYSGAQRIAASHVISKYA